MTRTILDSNSNNHHNWNFQRRFKGRVSKDLQPLDCKQYKFLKDHKEHKDSKLWKIHQNLSNMSYIIYSSKSPKLNISDV